MVATIARFEPLVTTQTVFLPIESVFDVSTESLSGNMRVKAREFYILASSRAVREDIRTLWLNRDPELLEIIQNIRTLEIKFGIRSKDDRRLAA